MEEMNIKNKSNHFQAFIFCRSNFSSGCFLGMITNNASQPYYHTDVVQCNGSVNQVNDHFKYSQNTSSALSEVQPRRSIVKAD